jgi:hemerythrin
VLIRELDELLMRWVGNHIALHDILLVRWLERDGASFSHSVPASG